MSLRYELVVRAGTDNPQKIRAIEKKILRHIPHPKYEETFYFDVALIILEELSLIKPRIKDIAQGGVFNPIRSKFLRVRVKNMPRLPPGLTRITRPKVYLMRYLLCIPRFSSVSRFP